MSSTATLKAPFSPESSEQEIEVRIGTALTKYVNGLKKKDKWSTKNCETAIACVKYLAHGTVSEASQQHITSWRMRFNKLKPEQSDLVYCLYIEVMTWDKPTLELLVSQLPE
jgi:hypothetical protein